MENILSEQITKINWLKNAVGKPESYFNSSYEAHYTNIFDFIHNMTNKNLIEKSCIRMLCRMT